jgi:hypothetical protein
VVLAKGLVIEAMDDMRRARSMGNIGRRAASWRTMRFLIVLCLLARAVHAACSPADHSHAQWSAILERWVQDGGLDYGGLQHEGQAPLAAYLASLSGTCAEDYERWTHAQRIAFWINAYNAFTVRLILDHHPIASIRRIGWLPGAAFREKFIPMQGLKGGTISLDEIEHGTLRSAFREPRIHFALVCASRSCPPLRREAYRGMDLDRQLDDQTRTFLRDPTKNRVDPTARTLYLSPIFKWFAGDFEAAAGSLPAYVAPYLGSDTTSVSDYRVEFLDYDWSLNDRQGGPQ